LVVLPEHKMAVAVLSSGGVSTYNQMAAERILVDALAAKGIAVDETLPTLPAAKPAPMPKKLTENSGYYGATTQQMKITVTEDGKLSIHSLTVPTMPDQIFSYCDDGSFRDPTGATMLKFVTEKNGETYIWQKAYGNLPGLGLLPVSNYLCQKLPENKLDDATQKTWDALFTMSVALLNETYTSQVYPTLLTPPAVIPEYAPGYLGAMKLLDATHGQFALQIPGNAGRDGQDVTVYQQDGTTYMNVQGSLFADAAAVPAIHTGSGAYCTVQPNGYARWYQIAPGDVGKTMTVTLPENSGFYVYDNTGAVIFSSVLYGDKTAVLPADGAIVFAGAADARFHLSFAPAPQA
ncbi:MAG: hydrolase, partial [Oscillospiraceae bacterium]